jgi:hypothetical protein
MLALLQAVAVLGGVISAAGVIVIVGLALLDGCINKSQWHPAAVAPDPCEDRCTSLPVSAVVDKFISLLVKTLFVGMLHIDR